MRDQKIRVAKEHNMNIDTLVHPNAIVSKLSLVQAYVMANAVINPAL